MKILLLAPHPFFANRGTPIAVRELLAALGDEGHTIDVLTYHVGEDIELPNVTLHRIGRPLLVNKVPIGPSWQKAVCDLWFLFAAWALVRRNHYDVIHAVEEAAFIAGFLRRLYGVPFIYDMDSQMSLQIREKSSLLIPFAKVFGWLEKRSIRRSLGVLAVCPALVEEAQKHHPRAKVELLPDVPFTGTAEGELPEALTGAGGTRIMYVGNLEAYQGIDLLLDAFARVADDCPDATLIIVGGNSQHIAAYRKRMAELVEQQRVRFVGPIPIEQLGTVMTYTDILASPRCKGNNTPMKIYSYLQSGKPIVATRLPTHTQVLNDDVAMLTEPTAEAMAEGLKALIESPQRRDELGQAGRDYVEANFSLAVFRRRLNRFYEDVARSVIPEASEDRETAATDAQAGQTRP